MRTLLEEIKKLRAKTDSSLYVTAQVQQGLAKLEAVLIRKENQKIKEKYEISCISCVKKFQTHNSYLRNGKTTYK